MKSRNSLHYLIFLFSFLSCTINLNDNEEDPIIPNNKSLPLLGWNSYTGYGNDLNDSTFRKNLDHFCQKLQPFGFEYFVIDAGWDGINIGIKLDEFGRSVPDSSFFPHGLKPLIDLVHSKGLKFGLWLYRGISRRAVERNLAVYGTNYRAQDIVNLLDTSTWLPHNYGVDMTKPGAQEYYNSVISLVGSWGIDFVKYDDIIPHPDEIEAIAKAIKNSGYDIKLSLSPGDEANTSNSNAYYNADMVRITADIWDKQVSIDQSFGRWEAFENFSNKKCNIDLDMIPFGMLFYPVRHKDNFSKDQKYTFMTQRAMSSSPLFVGGELAEIDSFSLAIITNENMLECNQNCSIGKLLSRNDSIDIWKSTHVDGRKPIWIGIFNRSYKDVLFSVNYSTLDLLQSLSTLKIFDIWNNTFISQKDTIELNIHANGVSFLKIFSN